MQQQIYSLQGKKLAKKISLDDAVFNAKINKQLMNLAVYVYLTNQRKSTAHTKTKAEVRGGGAKPWRQKGTGRARHGSIRSPIWKGGGVTFGPRNERNYKRKLTKKMKKAAIRSVLSFFANEKKIIILESGNIKDGKLTKQVVDLTRKLPIEGKVLFIQNQKNKNLHLGARNLQDVNVINVNQINVYTILKHKNLVILEDAAEEIGKLWGGEKKAEKQITDVQKKTKAKKESESEKVSNSLEDLNLSTRVLSSLEKANIKNQSDLKRMIEKGEKVPGVGAKSVEDIKKLLKNK